MMESKIPLLVIGGPTASGKTALALKIAERFPCEIMSADSRQVYRYMDIGTAKATKEERQTVPHHMIDVVNPDEEFSAADFVEQGRGLIEEIWNRGRYPLLVGGTGLYIKALTEGLLDAPSGDPQLRSRLEEEEERGGQGTLYSRLQEVDPELAATIHPRNLVRVIRGLEVFHQSGCRLSDLQREHAFQERPYRLLKIGATRPLDELFRAIEQRTDSMFAQGLIEETRWLLEQGFSSKLKTMQTIGYRESVSFLQGELALDDAVELVKRDTRRYAKRQFTWFRKDSSIIWVDSLREFAKLSSLIEPFWHDLKRSGHGKNPI